MTGVGGAAMDEDREQLVDVWLPLHVGQLGPAVEPGQRGQLGGQGSSVKVGAHVQYEWKLDTVVELLALHLNGGKRSANSK
jgi:hypothetical protein